MSGGPRGTWLITAALVAVALVGCAAPGGQLVAVSSVPSASPAPTETPTPTTAPIVLVPRPFVCVSTDLCYPRVFLSAHVVDQYAIEDPYDDVVRLHPLDRFGIVLAGHAYTKMSAIIQWRAGDDVVAYGQHFTVFDATYVQCDGPFNPPPAKLYLMTSIGHDPCPGHTNLLVMAR